MKRFLFLLAFVIGASGSALGQITTATITDSSTQLTNGEVITTAGYPGFHQNSCLQGAGNSFDPFSITWQTQAATTTYLAFGSTDSSCPAPSGDGGYSLTVENPTLSPQVSAYMTQLLQGTLGDPNACTTAGSGTLYLCVQQTIQPESIYETSVTTEDFAVGIPYDMNPPAAPTGVTVTPDDTVLDLSWNFNYDPTNASGDNPDHFVVYYQPDDGLVPTALGVCGSADGGVVPTTATTAELAAWEQATTPTPTTSPMNWSLGSLTNGQCYDVAVVAYYSDGTQGNPSGVYSAAPIEIWDYWRLYHAAGGQDQGGVHCQSAGGTLVPLGLILVVLFWLSQRRRAR
jgi:hypothetical protein